MGGGMEPPMGGGEESPPPPGPEGLPENKKRDNMKILLESDELTGDSYIDLDKARNSLGSMEDELSKLLKD
jgi:hypothetical protein